MSSLEESLYAAVATQNLSEVQRILRTASRQKDFNWNWQNPADQGKTAYHVAAERGFLEILGTLCHQEFDVNSLDFLQRSPFALACSRSDPARIEIVKWLLEEDRMQPDIPDRYGRTAVWMCVSRGDIEILEFIVASGAEFDLQAESKADSPLYPEFSVADLPAVLSDEIPSEVTRSLARLLMELKKDRQGTRAKVRTKLGLRDEEFQRKVVTSPVPAPIPGAFPVSVSSGQSSSSNPPSSSKDPSFSDPPSSSSSSPQYPQSQQPQQRPVAAQKTPNLDKEAYNSGILFVYNINSVPYLLVGKEGGLLSDFGGKADPGERSTYVTAAREVREETIGLLDVDPAALARGPGVRPVLVPKERGGWAYVLFVVRLADNSVNANDLKTLFKKKKSSFFLPWNQDEVSDIREIKVAEMNDYHISGRLSKALDTANGKGAIEALLSDPGNVFKGVKVAKLTSPISEAEGKKIITSLLKKLVMISAGQRGATFPLIPLNSLLTDASGNLPSNERVKNVFDFCQTRRDIFYSTEIRKDGKTAMRYVALCPSSVHPVFDLLQSRISEFEGKIDKERSTSHSEEKKYAKPLQEPPEPPKREIYPLDPSSKEYQHVLGLSKVGNKPTAIRKVELADRKDLFNKRQVALGTLPQVGFHGTPSVANGENIARKGPDFSKCGTHGSALGQGFYIAQDPTVSHGYIHGGGTLCVLHFVTGKVLQGGNSSLTPASLNQQGYQSIQSANVFVVSMGDQILVNYLVDFGPIPNGGFDPEREKEIAKKTEAWLKWKLADAARKAGLQKAKISLSRVRQAESSVIKQFQETVPTFRAVLEDKSLPESQAKELLHTLSRDWLLLEHEFQEFFTLQSPIYAVKERVIEAIRQTSTLFVLSPTGSGKTVCIPLWIRDFVFPSNQEPEAGEKPPGRIAVLVPRVDIAREQANFVANLRQWKVGYEVGYAVATDTVYDLASRDEDAPNKKRTSLVFMTYGYFSEILANKKSNVLDEWSAVVLDETHERQSQGDTLMGQVRDLQLQCKKEKREYLKVIMLSATMDPEKFKGFFEDEGIPTLLLDLTEEISCPFPVEIEYSPIVELPPADGKEDQPKKKTSKRELADTELGKEVVPLLEDHLADDSQTQKNTLIFVSTPRTADALASILREKLSSSEAEVLSLHGKLDPMRRSEIINLTAEEDPPKIIVCTNIAESGLTLKNVSLVIDTGKRMVHHYNPELHMVERGEEWISRASAEQRKGRAGRVCPGKCIRLYTESNLREDMPAYDAARIHHSDISRSLLRHLLGPGNDLETFKKSLPEPPSDEHIKQSHDNLTELGLLDPSKVGLATKIAALPMDLRWACCILAATSPKLECPVALTKITCLMEQDLSLAWSSGLERYAEHAGSDHEVLLNVYESWERSRSSDSYWDAPDQVADLAYQFQIVQQRVTKIQGTLTTLGVAPKDREVNLGSPQSMAGRSERIRRALCTGFYFSVGVPTNTDGCNLRPLDDRYQSLTFRTESESFLSGDRLKKVAQLVLFTNASRPKDSSSVNVKYLASVAPEWLEEASQDWCKHVNLSALVAEMTPCSFTLPIPDKMTNDLFTKKMISNIQRSFPFTRVTSATRGATHVTVTCPKSLRDSVRKLTSECLDDCCIIEYDMPLEAQYVRAFDTERAKETMKALVKKQGLEKLTFNARTKKGTIVELTCNRVFMRHFESVVRIQLGLDVKATPATVGNQTVDQVLGNNPRWALLQDPTIASESILQSPTVADQGRNLLAMAHFVTHHTQLFIFGGFIRDYLVTGQVHNEMDLDVGFDTEYGKNPAVGGRGMVKATADREWQRVCDWAKTHGIVMKKATPKGNNVTEYSFSDGKSSFSAEVVDVSYFRGQHGLPDIDVNTLRILTSPSAPFEAFLSHKFPDGSAGGSVENLLGKNGTMAEVCGSVGQIINQIKAKKMRVLNPAIPNERIQKFRSRGWTVSTN